MVSEWFSNYVWGHSFFCIALVTWQVHLIFSASQNGKLPPMPRSSENNCNVSKFSFHLSPSLGCLIICNYCVCQYLAKHLSTLLWWQNPHSKTWFFTSMVFLLERFIGWYSNFRKRTTSTGQNFRTSVSVRYYQFVKYFLSNPFSLTSKISPGPSILC